MSVVGIYDSYDDQYLTFEEKEMGALEERLKLADVIAGFNIRGFDMKVLAPYLISDYKKWVVLDLLDEIHAVRGAGCNKHCRAMARAGWKLPHPCLVVGDGYLGSQGAPAQVYPEAAEQRCRNYRILNLLTKRRHAEARRLLTPIS